MTARQLKMIRYWILVGWHPKEMNTELRMEYTALTQIVKRMKAKMEAQGLC